MKNDIDPRSPVPASGEGGTLATGRRSFFRKTLAIVPLSSLAACGDKPPTTSVGATAPPYLPRFFDKDEWAFIHAAVERLIPSDADGPGAVEAGVPEYIDRQMDTPYGHGGLWYTQGPFVESLKEFGYQGRLSPQQIYRIGIAAVDRHCKTQAGGVFASLSGDARDAVLHGLEEGKVALDDVSAAWFFAMLLQNTREGYFCDPVHGGNKGMASWKMIGFPGARADFMDWVDQYGKVYPFGPVDIAGRRA